MLSRALPAQTPRLLSDRESASSRLPAPVPIDNLETMRARRLCFSFILVLGCVGELRPTPASNTTTVFAPDIAEIPSPAQQPSLGGALARGSDGSVYLSWVETKPNGVHRLLVARLAEKSRAWSKPVEIYAGRDLAADASDFPTLGGGAKTLAAVWDDGHGRAFFSRSLDEGQTWTAPAALTKESDRIENPTLAVLANGQVLAAWLDGRGSKEKSGSPQRLYARLLDANGPDTLVDPRVCECCQLAFTAFPDGSALLAYRGRTEQEVRDIVAARFVDGTWEARRQRSEDGWKIDGCPVNGPRVVSDGPRVVASWFTAATDEPRVLVSSSADAGATYTLAERVDLGHALGHVDVLLLRDGTQLISWLETAGDDPSQRAGLYLRRYGPNGAKNPPVLLAALPSARAAGFPRLALIKDFDSSPAEIAVVYTEPADKGRVVTLRVTLPDAATLAAADSSCDCAPRAEEVAGYPLRGEVLGTSAERGTLRLKHASIPGVMKAGESEFKAAPNVLAALRPDREILGRIERRGGEWWIFDVRVLLRPRPEMHP
jgi:hypothetical protein